MCLRSAAASWIHRHKGICISVLQPQRNKKFRLVHDGRIESSPVGSERYTPEVSLSNPGTPTQRVAVSVLEPVGILKSTLLAARPKGADFLCEGGLGPRDEPGCASEELPLSLQ